MSGVRAKLARALEHREQFNDEVRSWIDPPPYELKSEPVVDGTLLSLSLSLKNPPNPRLGAIAGDIVHNLRSALDLLAWQLVLANVR